MNDDHSTRTEIVYRSIIERLCSEMKKQIGNEKDRQILKELKEVKNYIIYFFIWIALDKKINWWRNIYFRNSNEIYLSLINNNIIEFIGI